MKSLFTKMLGALLVVLAMSACQSTDSSAFWKGNMHDHSYWSDGNTYPEKVAEWYKTNGYEFLVVTDHNILQQGVKTRKIGEDTVQLKTLDEYRGNYEEPGHFLLISGEEVSDGAEGKPVHLNAINTYTLIPPAGGATVNENLKNNVQTIRVALGEYGNPEWITVNHPNFGWALNWQDLAECGARFFEVFNAHPSVRNYGDENHLSTEEMWDYANKWRLEQGVPLLLGVATDDTHSYHKMAIGQANPGRAWVMVRADELTTTALYQSMMEGNYYCSSGVVLEDIRTSKKSYQLKIAGAEGVTYTTEFIGWLKDQAEPEVLATTQELNPQYRFTGNEWFVRARITSGQLKENPYAEGDREMAWTQPVLVER